MEMESIWELCRGIGKEGGWVLRRARGDNSLQRRRNGQVGLGGHNRMAATVTTDDKRTGPWERSQTGRARECGVDG